jgi:hypothetical protein
MTYIGGPTCLCLCSIDHPGQPARCDLTRPVTVVSQSGSRLGQRIRVPLCAGCAVARGVPVLSP